MKIFLTVLLGITLIGLADTVAIAQTKKTIILVRHAEKDAAQSEMSADPELSVEGKQRAERLASKIRKYKAGAVYSTDYKRTRDTAVPTAKSRNLAIQIYDAKKPDELIDRIMKSKTKRFLVVGHSNTIPGLVNLLTKKELFKDLDDAEYGTLWLIKIKDGQFRKVEILPF
jgi:2,3-bisphosphoglycerate-dependent phosphoglycerate mutase